MNRRFAKLLALALCLCLLAGCSESSPWGRFAALFSSSQTDDTQEQEDMQEDEMASESVLTEVEAPDTLRLAYQASYGLNPYTCEGLTNRTIFCFLYEPLFVVNSQFAAEPVLAASVSVSDDGLTTTITLKSGVRFHSGAALTADDVVYSYTMARDSDYYAGRFRHFSGVTAQDDSTVVITTDTSIESVAVLLDFPIVRTDTGEDEVPDGTGPFSYSGGTMLKVFPQWWGDTLPLGYDQVTLVSCTTSTDIRDHFEYNSVNLVCTDPNSTAYATYHNETDYELWSCPTTVMQYVGFNTNSDVFSHRAIRAAVTFAIDRDTIVAKDLGGFAQATPLPAVPQSPYYDAGLAADFDLDLQAFQALMDEAQVEDYTEDGILDVYVDGYPVSVGGKMIVNAGNHQRVQSAQRIADSLNALGWDVTVEALEESDYRSALLYGNYDLYYGEIRLSPNFDLGVFFREGGAAAYGGIANGTMLSLCSAMLENSGNAYDLHKRMLEQGYLCPVLFKTYALYASRGAASGLNPALDWVVHTTPA